MAQVKSSDNFEYIDRAKLKIKNMYTDEIPLGGVDKFITLNPEINYNNEDYNNLHELLKDLAENLDEVKNESGSENFLEKESGIGWGDLRIYNDKDELPTSNSETNDNQPIFQTVSEEGKQGIIVSKQKSTDLYNRVAITDGRIIGAEYNNNKDVLSSTRRFEIDYNGSVKGTFYNKDGSRNYKITASTDKVFGQNILSENTIIGHNGTNMWYGAFAHDSQPFMPLGNGNSYSHMVSGTKMEKKTSKPAGMSEADWGAIMATNQLGSGNVIVGNPDAVKIAIPKMLYFNEGGIAVTDLDYKGKKVAKNSGGSGNPDDEFSNECFYTFETIVHSGNANTIMSNLKSYYEIKLSDNNKPVFNTSREDTPQGLSYRKPVVALRVPKTGFYFVQASATARGVKSSTDKTGTNDRLTMDILKLTNQTNVSVPSAWADSTFMASIASITQNGGNAFLRNGFFANLNKNDLLGILCSHPSDHDYSWVEHNGADLKIFYIGDTVSKKNANAASSDGRNNMNIPTYE